MAHITFTPISVAKVESHGRTKGQYSKCLTSGSPDTDQSGHRSAIEWECSGRSLLYQMLALCLQDYEKWRQGRSLGGFEVTWCGSILITIQTNPYRLNTNAEHTGEAGEKKWWHVRKLEEDKLVHNRTSVIIWMTTLKLKSNKSRNISVCVLGIYN